jgi:hypothetical protein
MLTLYILAYESSLGLFLSTSLYTNTFTNFKMYLTKCFIRTGSLVYAFG